MKRMRTVDLRAKRLGLLFWLWGVMAGGSFLQTGCGVDSPAGLDSGQPGPQGPVDLGVDRSDRGPEGSDGGGTLDGAGVDGGPDLEDLGPSPSTDGGAGPSCGPAGPRTGSVQASRVTHPYRLYLPEGRGHGPGGPDGTTIPLIIQLHGGASTGAGMEAVSGLEDLADRAGFAVLTPEGWPVGGRSGPQVWNAGACCGPVERAPDQVEAISRILDQVLRTEPCLDRRRVYATGHSNGGMMAYRLACQLSDRIAAVAVSAGALTQQDLDVTPPVTLFPCAPQRPVSVLHVHGLQDECAPYDGGENAGGVTVPSVEATIQTWRDLNGCGPGRDRTEDTVRRRSWSCRDDSRVELITVEALGHPWAGSSIYPSADRCGGNTTDRVSTTEELWRFFQAVPGLP